MRGRPAGKEGEEARWGRGPGNAEGKNPVQPGWGGRRDHWDRHLLYLMAMMALKKGRTSPFQRWDY